MYLVENHFCSDIRSLRNQVYCRYANFVNKLKTSSSYEVQVLSEVFRRDARSKTCQNLKFLNEKAGVDVMLKGKAELRKLFPKAEVPRFDQWRISLLNVFLEAKNNVTYRTELNLSETYVKDMIDSLCSS